MSNVTEFPLDAVKKFEITIEVGLIRKHTEKITVSKQWIQGKKIGDKVTFHTNNYDTYQGTIIWIHPIRG